MREREGVGGEAREKGSEIGRPSTDWQRARNYKQQQRALVCSSGMVRRVRRRKGDRFIGTVGLITPHKLKARGPLLLLLLSLPAAAGGAYVARGVLLQAAALSPDGRFAAAAGTRGLLLLDLARLTRSAVQVPAVPAGAPRPPPWLTVSLCEVGSALSAWIAYLGWGYCIELQRWCLLRVTKLCQWLYA